MYTCTGIEVKFKGMHYPVIIAATHIPELKKVEYTETGICFGSSVTLATLDETLKKAVQTHDGELYNTIINVNLYFLKVKRSHL